VIGISGILLRQIGYFDELLGVRSSLGAAEDLDFAYRAFRASERPFYTNQDMIGHREFNKTHHQKMESMRKYWAGTMFVTLRNAEISIFPLIIYRIGVGLYLMFRAKIDFATFLRPFVIFWSK
jgi:hypothetical protein